MRREIEKRWEVSFDQNGGVALPADFIEEEMVLDGEHLNVQAFAVSIRCDILSRKRVPTLRGACIELSPRLVESSERVSLRTQNRIYLGCALSLLGLTREVLHQLPFESRTVELQSVRVETGASSSSFWVYQIPVGRLIDAWVKIKRKEGRKRKRKPRIVLDCWPHLDIRIVLGRVRIPPPVRRTVWGICYKWRRTPQERVLWVQKGGTR